MTAESLELSRQQNMEHYGFGPDAMKKLRVCTVCGTAAPPGKHFCIECGHRLPDKTLYDLYLERHKVCPVCRAVLADEMEFCPQCGTKT